MRALAVVVAILALARCGPASTGHTFQPAHRDFTDALLHALGVPAGFRVGVFARLENPRMLAVADDGAVYATLRAPGKVVRPVDRGDGTARVEDVVALGEVHGVTIHAGRLYLADARAVYRTPLAPDGRVGALEKIASLLEGGRHPNRTLAFGPDGWLYVSVGSTCNACKEKNPESATILRMRDDGSSRHDLRARAPEHHRLRLASRDERHVGRRQRQRLARRRHAARGAEPPRRRRRLRLAVPLRSPTPRTPHRSA